MACGSTQTFTIVSGSGLGNENSDDEPMECHLWHIVTC